MDIIMDDDDDFAEAVGIIMQDDDWSSSDEEDDIPQYAPAPLPQCANVWGRGSVVGKAPNLDRQRVYYSHLLFNDFWGPSPLYDKYYFKKFFKMSIGLFDMIVANVVADDDYFRQKPDACGQLGLTSLQKLCCALRQVTSGGVAANELDDKYRMHETTGLKSMKRFCHSIVRVYGDTALRHPNASDMDRLLDEGNSALLYSRSAAVR